MLITAAHPFKEIDELFIAFVIHKIDNKIDAIF